MQLSLRSEKQARPAAQSASSPARLVAEAKSRNSGKGECSGTFEETEVLTSAPVTAAADSAAARWRAGKMGSLSVEIHLMSIAVMLFPRMMHDEIRLIATCINGETIRIRRVPIRRIPVCRAVFRSNTPAESR